MQLKVKLLTPTARIPTCINNSAGYDLYSDEDIKLPAAVLEIQEGRLTITPPKTTAVSTGIAMQFNEFYVAQIWDRSGLGFKGLHRFAGVCDGNYTGEYKVVLVNFTGQDYEIKKGDRIAQVLFVPIEHPDVVLVDELEDTKRSVNGFGSSGV